jgi:hypothetical protein
MRGIVAGLAIGLVLAAVAADAIGQASGIRGRVTSSPTCPVERTPPDPACAPRGFAARVRIERASDGQVVARLRASGDGRFSVALAPGRYRVIARPGSGQLPTCPSAVKATVRSGRYTRVAIDCDSGIR